MDRETLLAELARRSRGKIAGFHAGQWEAIDAVANRHERRLVVQRTGWGKSVVYFGATLVLRAAGAGPTLVVSPLLALVRDQVRAAAEDFGLVAMAFNHQNTGDWDQITAALADDAVDVLFLTPQKLANDEFLRTRVLPHVGRSRLLVVDEAHCISTWGHSFMPDYQRIRRLLGGLLPPGIGVLATTATADDAVVADVVRQLGAGTAVSRGPLARDSLHLRAIHLPSRAERYAWLAHALHRLPGSGIIYTLTTRDADQLADWLKGQGHDVEAYHSRVEDEAGDAAGEARRELEDRLRANQVKALVSTTALGMGYDKPDLAFVIHFQAPQSIIQYYQQVGRAGRALDRAYGILLAGEEDEEVVEHFIRTAFPPDRDVAAIVAALEGAEEGLSVNGILKAVDLPRGRVEKALAIQAVRDDAPVYKDGSRWFRSIHPFRPDGETVARVTAVQRRQWQRMKAYATTDRCLMRFLAEELDDPHAADCGKCHVCANRPLTLRDVPPALVQAAADHIRRTGWSRLPLPRMWPGQGALAAYGWTGRVKPWPDGRALFVWGDPGWAALVKAGKEAGHFSDELVHAAAGFVRETWGLDLTGLWVAAVPSLRRPGLVPGFAGRLAGALGVPYVPALEKVRETPPQKEMQNRWHQAHNLDGAFRVVDSGCPAGPVLLVDDMVDSGWSLTICSHLLHGAGAGPVHPFALALAKSKS